MRADWINRPNELVNATSSLWYKVLHLTPGRWAGNPRVDFTVRISEKGIQRELPKHANLYKHTTISTSQFYSPKWKMIKEIKL